MFLTPTLNYERKYFECVNGNYINVSHSYNLTCNLQCISKTYFYFSGYELPFREDSKHSKIFPFGYLETKRIANLKRDDDFNALNDLRGSLTQDLDSSYRDSFLEEDGNQFQDHRKKSDSRPKYDPGWKFIGLGKRNEFDEELQFVPEMVESNDAVNPLLGISTLINFEFFNAIKDGLEDAARETVKKEGSVSSSSSLSGTDSGSRYNNKLNLFSGRQKSMYDPGWMLTGLGK